MFWSQVLDENLFVQISLAFSGFMFLNTPYYQVLQSGLALGFRRFLWDWRVWPVRRFRLNSPFVFIFRTERELLSITDSM